VPLHHLYLAGPDVFRPDAVAHGQRLVAQCARLGFDAVFPLNTELPAGLDSAQAVARHIYEANIAHIERCDAVVANLDFFRGPEPDSGTCFEVGYAIARGKPVVGYLPDEGTFAQRIRQRFPHAVAQGEGGVDTQGWQLEEFALPLNLMLAVPCRVVTGGLEAALQVLRSEFAAS
jgi:nucleoside 2-deoxyribosyltransferase